MSACGHEHPSAPGLRGRTLEAALAAAERRCAQAGERLTAPRRRVLELLLEAGQPAKAYDLMAAYGAEGGPAKPPTVYRALEFLARLGLAHRVESLNAFVACRLGEASHTAGFLICDCCGAAREIEPVASTEVREAAAASGFALTGMTIEAHGLCADCAAA
jgi:Fur family zinc uptake transcriptional regulator